MMGSCRDQEVGYQGKEWLSGVGWNSYRQKRRWDVVVGGGSSRRGSSSQSGGLLIAKTIGEPDLERVVGLPVRRDEPSKPAKLEIPPLTVDHFIYTLSRVIAL